MKTPLNVRLISNDPFDDEMELSIARLPSVIGRGIDADVHFDDCWLSRRHCEIKVRDGELVVRDLGSSNGTFVNGAVISEPIRLLPGDKLTAGMRSFLVLYECASEFSQTDESGIALGASATAGVRFGS